MAILDLDSNWKPTDPALITGNSLMRLERDFRDLKDLYDLHMRVFHKVEDQHETSQAPIKEKDRA